MELFLVFFAFLAAMAVCLGFGISMTVPLAFGLLLFSGYAYRQGFSVREIFQMAKSSMKSSLIVVSILLLIGCLTGLWRASGTIAYFVSAGLSLMPPKFFLLAAFLLTSLMAYALGTSFGVTATCGVILMAIARAGNINLVLAAGAIYSGVYVGDRGSPAASSGNLVAVLTGTDMRDNVRRMLKSSILAFGICCVAYGVLSFFFPLQNVDTALLGKLASLFELHWLCLLPAVVMLLLPFCKVPIKWSMAVSIVVSFLLCLFVQKMSFLQTLQAMLLGYKADDETLSTILSGGGVKSMIEICCILLISGAYGGIFQKTGMLTVVQDKLEALRRRLGRYPAVLLTSVLIAAVFCNQTISIIMQNQLTGSLYKDTEEEKRAKMLDIEDSVVLTAGWIPWSIACSVPLSMMGMGYGAVAAAFYVYLVPLICLLQKSHQSEYYT